MGSSFDSDDTPLLLELRRITLPSDPLLPLNLAASELHTSEAASDSSQGNDTPRLGPLAFPLQVEILFCPDIETNNGSKDDS